MITESRREEVSVEILPFHRRFDRSSFSCGKPDLDDWLKTKAGQQERAGNTRTFLAVDGSKVVGYYATTAYRLGLDEAAAMYGVGKRAYPVPAVLLARLAVDVGSQGSGVGSKLLFHALSQIAEASRHVGFEVVVVHAIDLDAVTFYAQRGFTQFQDHELHLFMPVKDLLATLASVST
jgi:predicted N-acetyltransferase YhbS